MITPQTTLLGKATGSADQVLAWATKKNAKRLDFLKVYLNVLYQLGEQTGVNPDLAAMQSAHETAEWSSAIWIDRGNPAGIGVMGSSADDYLIFATGTIAARAQIAHLLLYATGRIDRGGLAPSDDPRYDAYLQAYGNRAIATFASDLAGTWALDPDYAAGIAAQSAMCFGTSSNQSSAQPENAMAATFGNVPFPAAQARYVTDAESGAWDNLGQKSVKGVVWHRMEGTLAGTDLWFRRGRGVSDGLTEFGVGTANIDGAALDGVIYVWNDPIGRSHPGVSPNRAPWASGPVSSPYGDGLAFLQDNKMDVNIVNRDQAAIEISGSYADPVSQAAKNAVAALTAYYADQAQIPWTSWPIIPKKGYSFVRWHQEFTIGTGKVCPGQVVMDATNDLIELVRAILKKYQTQTAPAPKPATYLKPSAIPTDNGQNQVLNGHLFYAIARTVLVTSDLAYCRASADPNAGETRAPLKKGQGFKSVWAVKGADGKLWWVTAHGSRISSDQTDSKWPF